MPLLLGGLVAAGIGWAIPTFLTAPDPVEVVEPERVSALEGQLDALRAEIASSVPAVAADVDLTPVQSLIETLSARIEALEAAPGEPAVDLDPLRAELDALRGELPPMDQVEAGLRTELQDALAALSPRIEALEAGAGTATVDLSPFRAELEALRAEVVPLGEAESGLRGEVSGFSEALSGLSDRVERLGASMDSTQADLTALRDTVAPLPGDATGLGERMTGLADEFTALRDDLSGLPDQFATLRDEVSGLQDQFATLRGDVEDRLAAVETQVEEIEVAARDVEAEAQAAAREAARNQLLLAVRTGGVGYAEQLDVLGGDVPGPLADPAETGIPTFAELQADYPALARAALREARRLEPSGSGIEGILARVTNARSLEPRDGDDSDAVLSRAETALAEGDLGTALAEIQRLPTKAQAEFDDWLSRARTRLAAERALPDYLSTPG